ncbi:MAG: hypothetical protein IPM47_07085 [Sphingobacteriales bacterium]|nr:MAG: hypothetical protein IPM47_07085 [Sphingobacteriales bacterium]
MNTTLNFAMAFDGNSGHSAALSSLFPEPNEMNLNSRLFILSAGTGEPEHARHFSQILCRVFQQNISSATALKTQRLGQVFVNDTLRKAEREIQNYLLQYPRLKNVYGVMALAFINTDGSIALSWVGNCRAYHIRNGKILYQTEDHLANLLQDNKLNIIPRAVNGTEPAWASLSTITNLRTNDIFMLCTPSVVEQIGNQYLEQIFFQNPTADQLFQNITSRINARSASLMFNGNACFMLRIEDSILSSTSANHVQGHRNFSDYADLLVTEQPARGFAGKRNLILQLGILIIVLLIIAAGSFLVYRHVQQQPQRALSNIISEAQALAAEGNYERAIFDLEAAMAIHSADTELTQTAQFLLKKMKQEMMMTHADSLFEAGNWFEAKSSYDMAFNIDTENYELKNRLSVVGKLMEDEKRSRLSNADSLLQAKDYIQARNQLFEALLYDQNNRRIVEKINLCNLKLKQDTLSLSAALQQANIYLSTQKDTLK